MKYKIVKRPLGIKSFYLELCLFIKPKFKNPGDQYDNIDGLICMLWRINKPTKFSGPYGWALSRKNYKVELFGATRESLTGNWVDLSELTEEDILKMLQTYKVNTYRASRVVRGIKSVTFPYEGKNQR